MNEHYKIICRHKEFTLVELLVVIAIIAILASLLLPALTRAKVVAKQSTCLSNMKQVGQGIFLYTDDWNEYFPSETYASYTSRTYPSTFSPYNAFGAWMSPLSYIAYEGYAKGPTKFGTAIFAQSFITSCPVYFEWDNIKTYWGTDMNNNGNRAYGHGGTYSFNMHFDQTLTLTKTTTPPSATLKKFFTVPRLSSRAVFLEGTSSQLRTTSSLPTSTTGAALWWGHGGRSANYLFGDGHAESKNISSAPLIDAWPNTSPNLQAYGADTPLKEPW